MSGQDEPTDVGVITERVAEFTRRFPEKALLTWVDAQGRDTERYTYEEFDQAARRVAGFLAEQGIVRGDTAILAYAPGADFFVAFWACLRAGIIAVPVVPPFTQNDVKKFLRVVTNSDARVILTDRMISRIMTLKIRKHQAARLGRRVTSLLSSDAGQKDVGFADLESLWRLTTSGLTGHPLDLELKPQPPSGTAFLMYSSGTTSSPKGAETTFDNLRHQLEMNSIAIGSDSSSISCWWAPHYHDYGLISGFLNVLHVGASAVITSPMHFIQRPALWLDMLHRHRGTHTFGPDFAYLLLVKKTTAQERTRAKWDLSALKVAMSAAEKVRFATLKEFEAAFAPCGFEWEMFCPAYGLAEHTVGVTINGHGDPPCCIHVVRSALEQLGKVYIVDENDPSTNPTGARTVALVGSGVPRYDTDVRIVQLDEDGDPALVLDTDEVGEIWVHSESKTAGYYKMPALTETAFHARLPDGSSDREYLRTGDLGFFSSHTGELFVCGRQKEMVIIAGKNHFSEDLELTIAESAGHLVRPGRVATFSVDDPTQGTEVLAVAAEVRDPKGDCSVVIDAICRSVSSAHKITVSEVALLPPGAIPKTSSGKLRRVQAKRDLLAGTLDVLPGGRWSRDDTTLDEGDLGSMSGESSLVGFLRGREMQVLGGTRLDPPAPPRQITLSQPIEPAAPPQEVVPPAREGDFNRFIADFRDFVTENGVPAAFPAFFPECGEGFEEWTFLTGAENIAQVFDDTLFERMPVWNFTRVNQGLFDAHNFPRWANGATHRRIKAEMIALIEARMPTLVARVSGATDRFLDNWMARGDFPWLFEFDQVATDLFCEIFAGRPLENAVQLFQDVLFGLDPFRKRSYTHQQVVREENVEAGQAAKDALIEFLVGQAPNTAQQLEGDLLVGAGGFAVIPGLKNVLINLFARLSTQLDLQARVLAEVSQLAVPFVDTELRANTPLLEACILETIRLYPPVGHLYARAKADVTISGIDIAQGSNVAANTWGSYRDARFFRHPDRFDPDRFLPPRNEHLDGRFEPFGVGPIETGHACPGQDMALLTCKTVIARALLRSEWQLATPAWDDTRYRERYGVPNFEDGMRVTEFRRRSTQVPAGNGQQARRTFTLASLRAFDGSEPTRPVYLALSGVVYDVSAGRAFYGPGGPYGKLAGRDATRAMALMSLDDDAIENPRVDDLTPAHHEALEEWAGRLSAKYPVIGHIGDARPIGTPQEAPLSWRIAVVGGGVAGMTCALSLAQAGYQVTLLEKRPALGGHATSKPIGLHMRQPAFGVIMETQWPNAWALLNQLGVDRIRVSTAREGIVHFAPDGHEIPYDSIKDEVERFGQEMVRRLHDPEMDGVTIGEYLSEEGYSDAFICYHFLGRVIHFFAGQPIEYYLSYPLRLIAWMYLGTVAHEDELVYRVDNVRYREAFLTHLGVWGVEVFRDVDVSIVSRDDDGVGITYNGAAAAFDQVVLAVQPHHALRLLGDRATPEEKTVLGGFRSTVDTVVMHTDPSWVPADRDTWGFLHLRLPNAGEPLPTRGDTVPFTTAFTSDTDGDTPIFCTYAYAHADAWAGAGPHWTHRFEHLEVTPETQRLRAALVPLNGADRVHFAGSWTRGLTLHEDAVVSGLQAANRIVGPARATEIREPAMALPDPFQVPEDRLGANFDEVVATLGALVCDVLDTPHPLHAETQMADLGLTSLDFARLASAIGSRSAGPTPNAERLYELQTLGDLARALLRPEPIVADDVRARPPLVPHTETSADADGVERHPVARSQGAILTYHFLRMQRFSDWNIPARFWLDGPLDVGAFEAALRAVVDQHEALRTTFTLETDGSFLQRVHPIGRPLAFTVRDVVDEAEAVRNAVSGALAPIDVNEGVLFVELYRVSPTRTLVFVLLHHAIADGWAVGVFFRALRNHYAALLGIAGSEETPSAPALQFTDFVHWQRALVDGGHFDGDLAYWRTQLEAPIPFLARERSRRLGPGESTTQMVQITVPPAQVARLKTVAKAWRTSVNMLLLTTYGEVLCGAAKQAAVLVQVPVANRPHDAEDVMGCFVENMLVRVQRAAGSTPRAAAAHTHSAVRTGLQRLVPLPLILEQVHVDRADAGRLHRAVLNWDQVRSFRDDLEMPFGDLTLRPFVGLDDDVIDLPDYAFSVLNINENTAGEIVGFWQYDARVFTAAEMDAHVAAFMEFLRRVDGTYTPPPEPSPKATLFADAVPAKGGRFSSKRLFGSKG